MTRNEFMDSFAKNLQYQLDLREMSQADLARLACIDRATICRYLNKTRLPSLPAIINICYALRCDIIDICPSYDIIDTVNT